MNPHLALSLDIATGIVIAAAILGIGGLGLSWRGSAGGGLVLLLAALAAVVWLIGRNFVPS